MTKIAPTTGRVVLYFPSEQDRMAGMEVYSERPCAAHVAYVWSETCINLLVIDHAGNTWPRRSVPINDGGATTPRADWMDYQKGQAPKTEKAEAALACLGLAIPGVASAVVAGRAE